MEWLITLMALYLIVCCGFCGVADYHLMKYFHEKGIFMAWLGLIALGEAALIAIPIILFIGG